MLVQQAFRYRLAPDGAQRRAFARFAGAKRFVWNKALQQDEYLGYAKTTALLPVWKQESPWLRETHSQVLQQGLKDLDEAFQNFFQGRNSFPKPKKKGKSIDSFRFPQGSKGQAGIPAPFRGRRKAFPSTSITSKSHWIIDFGPGTWLHWRHTNGAYRALSWLGSKVPGTARQTYLRSGSLRRSSRADTPPCCLGERGPQPRALGTAPSGAGEVSSVS
jgi:transposase